MNLITLGDLRPVVAQPLNLCPTDSRIPSFVNRAQERCMARGDWLGTYQVYRICINSSCLVYPRPVERITLLDVDEVPIPVRNQWFEFLENGPGFMVNVPPSTNGTTNTTWSTPCCGWGWSCMPGCMDRGTTCLYTDIRGTAKKLKVYADLAEVPTARIIFRGYDENMNWIQTETPPGSGIWMEGESVAISNAGVVSVKKYRPPGPQVILKDVTRGVVRVYSYDDSTLPAAQELLGIYEPGETRPIYRRYLIPNLQQVQGTDDSACLKTTVTALVKLRHIDVVSDNDTLILQNREALRMACMAIRKEEINLAAEANIYWEGVLDKVTGRYKNGAIPLLQEELDNHLGPGAVNPMRYESPSIAGPAVLNLI